MTEVAVILLLLTTPEEIFLPSSLHRLLPPCSADVELFSMGAPWKPAFVSLSLSASPGRRGLQRNGYGGRVLFLMTATVRARRKPCSIFSYSIRTPLVRGCGLYKLKCKSKDR